ncbi:replication-associated recombination protein A [Candidatus Peregrinibacteria bacterium]|nr:replication-associated recombination protein A [Candidatus Peregrinibacteria bacterium]MBI3816186.1 replication-associated recombination protein A [Candidatus Peregrinibacteria bacterium]
MDTAPLAYRMRPTTLDEFVGQEHVVGKGTGLRTAIEHDQLSSVILAGPPGTGKTTLAHIISDATKAAFVQINAVTSGIKELRAVCEESTRLREGLKQRTVLFIDEIHRFNTAQQDALLPFVESGTVILIGATTQNPSFDVNKALVSRSHVHLLKPLSPENLVSILHRAVTDERGYAEKITIDDDALTHIASRSNGDARIALNLLELAVLTVGSSVSLRDAQKLLRERRERYDASGEDHYDAVSAFIKTIRGSDPDAALLWLFSMLDRGEDPRFLFRRMAILASEDIGNADPRALPMVVSAWQAFELVGLPEGEFFLAHACVYLAQAPKSNAVTRAMGAAKSALRSLSSVEVPFHLRNAPMKGMREQGYGVGYQYPHDVREGIAQENYFPIGMSPSIFYEPTDRGFEAEVGERILRARAIRGRNSRFPRLAQIDLPCSEQLLYTYWPCRKSGT